MALEPPRCGTGSAVGKDDEGPNSARGRVARPRERSISKRGRRGDELGRGEIMEGLQSAVEKSQ